MALNTSPPLTSGVVVLSGSDFFNRLSSDFPVIMGMEIVDPIYNSPASDSVLILGNSPHVNSTGIFNYTRPGLMLTDPVAAGTTPVPNSVLILGNSPNVNSSGIGSTVIKGLMHTDVRVLDNQNQLSVRVLRMTQDTGIRSTPVTTSGVVILDIFPDAGEEPVVFVPPVVLNARIYPVFQGTIPVQDRRIFPVLPQFATLTPGD